MIGLQHKQVIFGKLPSLVPAQFQVEVGQFFSDLVQASDSKILAFQQVIPAAPHEFSDRI